MEASIEEFLREGAEAILSKVRDSTGMSKMVAGIGIATAWSYYRYFEDVDGMRRCERTARDFGIGGSDWKRYKEKTYSKFSKDTLLKLKTRLAENQ